jgi:hypothetical protein
VWQQAFLPVGPVLRYRYIGCFHFLLPSLSPTTEQAHAFLVPLDTTPDTVLATDCRPVALPEAQPLKSHGQVISGCELEQPYTPLFSMMKCQSSPIGHLPRLVHCVGPSDISNDLSCREVNWQQIHHGSDIM